MGEGRRILNTRNCKEAAMERSEWEGKGFACFTNRACEYFPCHKVDPEEFNCLFCFCPLYAYGKRCGGNFLYLENGAKDCSACAFPHKRGNYGRMMERLAKLQKRGEETE